VNQVATLARLFAWLSLMALGGGLSVFPSLKTQTVDVHGWLTDAQLEYLYSLGQLAPGPNMMVASIGEWVAGLPGAIVVVSAASSLSTTVAVLILG